MDINQQLTVNERNRFFAQRKDAAVDAIVAILRESSTSNSETLTRVNHKLYGLKSGYGKPRLEYWKREVNPIQRAEKAGLITTEKSGPGERLVLTEIGKNYYEEELKPSLDALQSTSTPQANQQDVIKYGILDILQAIAHKSEPDNTLPIQALALEAHRHTRDYSANASQKLFSAGVDDMTAEGLLEKVPVAVIYRYRPTDTGRQMHTDLAQKLAPLIEHVKNVQKRA